MSRRIILSLITALVVLAFAATSGFAEEGVKPNEQGCNGINTASVHNHNSLIEAFPGGAVPATQLCEAVVIDAGA